MALPPRQVCVSDSVVIKLLDEDDAPELQRAIEASRDHLTPFLPFATRDPSDVDFRRSWIATCRITFSRGERFQYGIVRCQEVIGGCSIDPIDQGMASIGFWVHVAHVRNGIGTAVARSLTETALGAGFETVRIRHDQANVASGMIAKRLGYERLGEEPHPLDAPGQTGTSVVWTFSRPR